MDLNPTEAGTLRQRLPQALSQYSEADPDALADFIMMFVGREGSREDLTRVFREELEVFCEDKTNDAVDALFRVVDTVKSGVVSDGTTSTPAAAAVAAAPMEAEQPQSMTAGQKRDKVESDDEEEEDDDDRNFKRRNVSSTAIETTTTTSNSTTIGGAAGQFQQQRAGEKRGLSEGVTGEERPKKHMRGADHNMSQAQEQLFSSLPSHLRSRLGPSGSQQVIDGFAAVDGQPAPRRRMPCRNFEERGYCVYGDNCKFDHGQEQITVNDYSKIQAIIGSSGTLPMSNPMIMPGPAGQMFPFPMGAPPFMTPSPMEGQYRQPHQQHLPHQQQRGQYQNKADLPYTTRYNPNSTCIVVDKIPLDACNIDAITSTFKKFGTIVDITLQPESSRAFIEFKTHAEALAAHSCPDVLFNNRFVKVYWKKEERKPYQQQQQQQQQQAPRQASPDPEAVKARAAELAKAREEKQKQLKERLDKQLEANKRKQELAKRELELVMMKAKLKAMEEAKKKAPQ